MNTVMDIKKYILFASAVFVLFCAASCNKDKTESYSYLTGAPEFTLPMFATAGESFTFTAKDVTADDGSKVGYCWYTTVLSIRDTIDTFTLTLPDTLCTVSLTCAAFADGYYNSTTTQSVTIVRAGRENGSITGLTAAEGRDFLFTDPRDGHSYLCATVGTKDWFRENLAYKGSGTALENCETVSDVFGRFYTWNEAISACPDGWRLSTLDDWADAASAVLDKRPDPSVRFQSAAGYFMGDLRFNGDKMWEYWPDVKITDKLGLSIWDTHQRWRTASISIRCTSMPLSGPQARKMPNRHSTGISSMRVRTSSSAILPRNRLRPTSVASATTNDQILSTASAMLVTDSRWVIHKMVFPPLIF